MSSHIKDQSTHTHTHTLPDFEPNIPIFTKLYDFYKNLSQILTTFPKSKRYTLGQKIDQTTLDIFEFVFKINTYTKDRRLETLQTISSKADLLKVLIRLAHDDKDLNTKNYLILQERLQEIGKMIGGWLRYLKNT